MISNPKENTFRDLQIFAAVAKFKSYKKAAENLGIDISNIGRRIKFLEGKLNQQLVIRSYRDIRITSEGTALYHEFLIREQSFIAMLEDFQGLPKAGINKINLAIPNGLVEYILSNKLPEYMHLHPEIVVNLTCRNDGVDIVSEGVDFAIIRNSPTMRSLIAKKLYKPKFYLYCTNQYKESFGVPQTLEELNSHLVVNRIAEIPRATQYFYATNGIETIRILNKCRLMTSSTATDRNVVLSNQAIVFGTDALFTKELNSGLIIKVLPEYQFYDDFEAFYLIYNEDKILSNIARELIEFIIKVFSEFEE